jgi:hypothetical protein
MAAPGDAPQIAVVPGRTFQRANTQPSKLLAAITDTIPARNSGQSRRISVMIESGMLRAMRQPTTPCASRKELTGTRVLPSFAATRMAAAIGPSRSAAGRCSASRARTKITERAIRIAHCAPVARRPPDRNRNSVI